jgi:hypothetical protein
LHHQTAVQDEVNSGVRRLSFSVHVLARLELEDIAVFKEELKPVNADFGKQRVPQPNLKQGLK